MGDCPQLPGLRNLACGGTGTRTGTGIVGTHPFDTLISTPCPTDRIKTDTVTQASKLDRGVFGLSAEVFLTPHIEWCWSGNTVVFVKKQNNQDTTWSHQVWSDDVQSVSIKKHNGVDPDPQVVIVPALYGNNKVGHYVASFDVAITFRETSTKVNCFLVIDRYYLDGGRKDIKDHTPICTTS
ncbi:hypothetical protein Psuf_061000 [Phytohabitans suffuscus]|uniref:Uncharacterized protein n=1 Tax=Phytohabitans suffuscus TaxID=624315 RepID=A0A6F8YRK9_9ACTN|nr:hypothetical protein [Phytohabitans suffuscus]BCB88787.1 hypothetical protein Psuf_061000 [Phytohabitans suffuscus]